MTSPRILLAAGVVAVVAVAAVLVLIAGDSDGDEDKPRRTVRAKLTLERFVSPATGEPELLISLPEKRLNSPETTGGESVVLLRCADEDGRVAVRGPTDWPLLEELGYPLPHIHQRASRKVLRGIRSCRLTGPGINFTGSVAGPPPPAAQ